MTYLINVSDVILFDCYKKKKNKERKKRKVLCYGLVADDIVLLILSKSHCEKNLLK